MAIKQALYVKKYRSLRRELGQAKKVNVIEKINDKEQRWMTDLNHKISSQLINLAVQEQVGTIVMENLENIRQTAQSLIGLIEISIAGLSINFKTLLSIKLN